jgi:hypothetical protein
VVGVVGVVGTVGVVAGWTHWPWLLTVYPDWAQVKH